MSGHKRAPATRDDALREIRAVELALASGHPIVSPVGDTRTRSAVRVVADMLALDRVSLARRIGTPEEPGTHARRFGLSPNWTLAAETGTLGTRPVLPGFAISSTSTQLGPDGELQREWIRQRKAPSVQPFEILPGQKIKGESALVDGQNRVLAKWIKTGEGTDAVDVVETIKAAFVDYPGHAAPVPMPAAVAEDKLALLPCADFHIGMYAWAPEAGSNWDLKLAEDVIGRAIEEAVARTEPCGQAIVLGGGDLLHADTNENRTARSGNALQVDGRYQKVLMVASRLMVRAVEANLRRHGHVTVRILPGNHDEHASVAVAYFLLAWFRHEPRVSVDVDPSLFFWFRFGDVFLGATHGHSAKIQDMPSIMAHRRAKDWGDTRHRFVHGFHLHHTAKFATEGHGVISEVHQSPVPQDAWHFGSGFLSGRSIQTITYHRRFGEVSRARVVIMDAEQEIAA